MYYPSRTKDGWIVLVPMVDKYVQAVRCHSMTKVKEDFPMYGVTKAVQEVKEDAPENKIRQVAKFTASPEDKLTA